MCIYGFGPSSSPSFAMLLIHSAFYHVLLVAIFCSKIVQLLLHPVVGMFSYHLPPLVSRIFFSCFGMSYFVCIVLHFLNIFLIFLLSPVRSGPFPRGLLLFFLLLLFPFLPTCFSVFSISFIIFACFLRFLICVSSRISHPGFDFLLVFFKGTPIFSQTTFSPE